MSRCSSSLRSSRHFSAEMDSTRLANAYIQLWTRESTGMRLHFPQRAVSEPRDRLRRGDPALQ